MSFRRQSVQPGAVEIEVGSAGLNFSDVLKAMGLYPGITDEIVPLGIECAGVVTAVGAGVDRFAWAIAFWEWLRTVSPLTRSRPNTRLRSRPPCG